jgi:hypothetical protein
VAQSAPRLPPDQAPYLPLPEKLAFSTVCILI